MTEANYSGRQPNNTSFIKTFVEEMPPDLWTINLYKNNPVLEPSLKDYNNVYIPGILYVDEIIFTNKLKINIDIDLTKIYLSDSLIDNLDKITVYKYFNINKKINSYGFEKDQVKNLFPDLINKNNDEINYLEFIPLLLNKIQRMQIEIDTLKNNLEN